MSTQQQSHVLLATDPSASVLVRVNTQGLSLIAYSPFGHAPPNQPAALSAFNGQVREHLLPIYLLGYGYRAFNTALQRFHTPDSLSPFDDGGLNAYAYCLADPINAVDPSGHRTIKGFKRVTNFFSNLFSAGSKTKKNSSVNLTKFTKKNSNTPSVTGKVGASAANPNTTRSPRPSTTGVDIGGASRGNAPEQRLIPFKQQNFDGPSHSQALATGSSPQVPTGSSTNPALASEYITTYQANSETLKKFGITQKDFMLLATKARRPIRVNETSRTLPRKVNSYIRSDDMTNLF